MVVRLQVGLFSGKWEQFLWVVKWPGHDGDHTPPSSAEIQRVVDQCLHGMYNSPFTFAVFEE